MVERMAMREKAPGTSPDWAEVFVGKGFPRTAAERAPRLRAVKKYCMLNDELKK